MIKYSKYLILSLIFSGACSEQKPQKNIKKTPPIKNQILKDSSIKSVLPKRKWVTDSITSENAYAFFKSYGQKHKSNKVLIETPQGKIYLKLYNNTPIHRASFVYLISKKYFNTTCFYRVVPDFIIQGGNSDDDITLKHREALNHYKIPAEFNTQNKHKRGVIAAARDWQNNPEKKSTPFEFYIVQGNKDLKHLNGEHTVFGEVYKGMAVVDKISKLKADVVEWPFENTQMTVTLIN